MRRLYDSATRERDEEEPVTRRDRRRGGGPQAFRSIDASAWSDRLVPHGLRCRFVSLRISTPQTEYSRGEEVPFSVTMTNRLPIPVTIRTASPVLWTWSVDGLEEASRVRLREPPDRPARLHFARGERKRFRKSWSGLFRVADREWRPAEPGTYTIRAEINVGGSPRDDLADETTVQIVD